MKDTPPRLGDVLICEGGYPGRAAIWTADTPIYFQKAIHRVRFREPARAKWLVYYLWLLDTSGELRNHFTGAGIQHFTGQALRRIKLRFPSLGTAPHRGHSGRGLCGARGSAPTPQEISEARELFDAYFDASDLSKQRMGGRTHTYRLFHFAAITNVTTRHSPATMPDGCPLLRTAMSLAGYSTQRE